MDILLFLEGKSAVGSVYLTRKKNLTDVHRHFLCAAYASSESIFTQALSEEERNKSQEEANKAKEELKQKTAIISGLNVSQWECFWRAN